MAGHSKQQHRPGGHPLAGGFIYFLLVFILGTILGGIRVMMMEPMVGGVVAVLVEMPIILAAAWFICQFSVKRFDVRKRVNDRLQMGFFAFACLMLAELILIIMLERGGITQFLQMFNLAENRIGLAGQILFAFFPLLQLYGSSSSRK